MYFAVACICVEMVLLFSLVGSKTEVSFFTFRPGGFQDRPAVVWSLLVKCCAMKNVFFPSPSFFSHLVDDVVMLMLSHRMVCQVDQVLRTESVLFC